MHQITSQLNARSDSLQDIRIVTQEDDELALLKHTIMRGWPSTMREVPSEIQPYWDLQGRADSGRWDSLERHPYCYSPQDMSSYT